MSAEEYLKQDKQMKKLYSGFRLALDENEIKTICDLMESYANEVVNFING